MKLRELYTGTKSFANILFSPKDAESVEILLDSLDEGGYRYWFNSKLAPNSKDLDEIIEKLRGATVAVLVLTENALTDSLIPAEVEYSLGCGRSMLVYIPGEDPEDRSLLNTILSRAKNPVVYRALEHEYRYTNAMKQILSYTKGVSLKEAVRLYESGLANMESDDPQVRAKAMQSIQHAANNDYDPALYYLGSLMLEGARRGEIPYSSALVYLKSAVRLGNRDAIYTVGCMIADGEGFAPNPAVAAKYISVAVQTGNADAQYRFAKMLEDGSGVAKNRAEALKWYKKALDGGDRRAYLPLAYRYLDGENITRNETIAARYFTEAAEDGSMEATLMLGKLYRDGVGVAKDSAKAERFFRAAAEDNIAEAQYNYAMILRSKGSDTEAFKWFKLAAAEREYGVDPAPEILYEIAQCYITGKGTEADRTKAFLYYHKAALAGHMHARRAVSECYKKGIGVSVNKRAAEFYSPKFAYES